MRLLMVLYFKKKKQVAFKGNIWYPNMVRNTVEFVCKLLFNSKQEILNNDFILINMYCLIDSNNHNHFASMAIVLIYVYSNNDYVFLMLHPKK